MIFPKQIILEDTGERRYPLDNEPYMWFDGQRYLGPCMISQEESKEYGFGWQRDKEYYAIYGIKLYDINK